MSNLNKKQLAEISKALKLLEKHGINASDFNDLEEPKTPKNPDIPKKSVTAKKKSEPMSDKQISAIVENAVEWTKNNPNAYSWDDLEQVMGKPSKLSKKQYNDLKKALKKSPKVQELAKSLKKLEGINKVLKLQHFFTFEYDLFINPYQVGTILNQVFKMKNNDIWYEVAG